MISAIVPTIQIFPTPLWRDRSRAHNFKRFVLHATDSSKKDGALFACGFMLLLFCVYPLLASSGEKNGGKKRATPRRARTIEQ